MGLIPAMKVTHHISRMKKWKSSGHVNSYGKSFENIEHSFMIKKNKTTKKNSQQTRTGKEFLPPIKGSHGKPTANTTLGVK